MYMYVCMHACMYTHKTQPVLIRKCINTGLDYWNALYNTLFNALLYNALFNALYFPCSVYTYLTCMCRHAHG